MHLYALTLQRSSAVGCAVAGSFSGPKEQEIVVSHGKAIELLRADAGGKLLSICYMECFGQVRSLAPVRLPGTNVDCLALGSDSGRLALVHYIPERDQFERIHLESYGKSGCRRTVAGQYMAVDPAGRALMIAAIEKQRVVYTFDRDANSLVSISAPIEAPRPGAITFSIAALDVGKGNPVFACIELEYAASTEGEAGEAHKMLSFYEVDGSKGSVVKRNSEPLDPASNMLIAVPGGSEGPGGVLVCAENKLAYFRATGGGDEVVTLLPRRAGMPIEQPLLITAHAVLRQSGKPASLLLQSEVGDVYSVGFSVVSASVSAISVAYYDTLPVAITLLALGPSPGGRLFVAGEFSDHRLYQFVPPGAGAAPDAVDMVQCEAEGERFQLPHFKPRGLRHLVLLDSLESLSPVLDLQCADLAGEDAMQLYALCGRGPRSSLRTLRHGLGVAEMAVSEMPFPATAVWTVKANAKDAHHSYIVVGLANDVHPTIVLAVGETVEMCTSVKLLTQVNTLAAAALRLPHRDASLLIVTRHSPRSRRWRWRSSVLT
jgi:splicing factor 3B subunit 3